MASTIIGTTIAGTLSSATGRGHQRHLWWATNDAAWWLKYISSSDSTHELTYRSPDSTTWTAKNSLTTFAAVGTEAMNFASVYHNKASNDVSHQWFHHTSNSEAGDARSTQASAQITWGSEIATQTNAV